MFNLQIKKPDLESETQAGRDLLEFATEMTINSETELADANTLLREIVIQKDYLKSEQQKIAKPISDIIRTVKGWFEPPLEYCQTIEALLKTKIATYVQEQRAEADRQFQLAAAANAAGKHGEVTALLNTASEIAATPPKGTSVLEYWEAQIIAPDLVPREWCVPNERAIAQHAKKTPLDHTPDPIPGVKFVKGSQVRIRRNG